MADKIDQLKLKDAQGNDVLYDIDLPPDATPSIAGLTVSGNVSDGTTTKTMTELLAGSPNITVSATNGISDGTNTYKYTLPSDVVQDSNYAHITVTSSSVSDGTTTFNKYTHPTYTVQTAGLYKIGRDSTGHVVIGDAFTIPTVNNASHIIQLNGTTIGTNFTANASSNITTNIQALPNYSLSISTSAGNPREAKFVRVNYTNFNSNYAAYFKIGAMCSHGNGSSYTFLEDIIIGVTSSGSATCTVYKQVQNTSTYTVDSHTVHFGDVYWVVDTTNKYVDFYIICGQYATINFTPFTAIGSTSKNTSEIVQQTGSATLYSSGTRVWDTLGNGSLYATTSDLSSYVPTTRTVNGKALSSDITLSASDVSALPSSTTYIKSASVSGNTLTLTKEDNTTQTFTPSFTDTNYYPIRSYTSGLQISSYSGSSNCQLYVPNASLNQSGVVTTGDQIFNGTKTFNNDVTLRQGDNGNSRALHFEYTRGEDDSDDAVIQVDYDSGGLKITPSSLIEPYYHVIFKPSSLLYSDEEAEYEYNFPSDDGTLALKKNLYRHNIFIFSTAWGTTSGTAGSNTRMVQFEIINNISYAYTTLSSITTALSQRGAVSSGITILARYSHYAGGVFAAKNGTVYNLGFIYRASTTSTTTTTNYLMTTSSATIEDRVTSFYNA